MGKLQHYFEHVDAGDQGLCSLAIFLLSKASMRKIENGFMAVPKPEKEQRQVAISDVIYFVIELFAKFDGETQSRVSGMLCEMMNNSEIGSDDLETIVDFIAGLPNEIIGTFVRELQPLMAREIAMLRSEMCDKRAGKERILKLLEMVSHVYDAEQNPMVDFIQALFPDGCTEDLNAQFQLIMEGLNENPDDVSTRDIGIMIKMYREIGQ